MNVASPHEAGPTKTLAKEFPEVSTIVRKAVESLGEPTFFLGGLPIRKSFTKAERQDLLDQLEVVIDRGMATFIEVGRALQAIQKEGLYFLTNTTFEDYCAERWDMSSSSAYRSIDAVRVADILSPIGEVIPRNEAQARELVPLLKQPSLLRDAWAEVRDRAGDGNITASLVREVVSEKRKKPTPRAPEDTNYDYIFKTARWLSKLGEYEHRFRNGVPIAPSKAHARKVWVDGAISYLEELRSELEKRCEP